MWFCKEQAPKLEQEHAAVSAQSCQQLMPGALEEPVFLESSWMGELVEQWASQLQSRPALISRPSCVHRETAKHKCQRKKRKAPIIVRPQEQHLKAKMPSGQQKGRSVQNSWLKKLCCFSQQPLRQDKEEICCMAVLPRQHSGLVYCFKCFSIKSEVKTVKYTSCA